MLATIALAAVTLYALISRKDVGNLLIVSGIAALLVAIANP
jgi:hypothetical protein